MFVASSEFSLGLSLLSPSDIKEISDYHSSDTVVVADTMTLTGIIDLTEKLEDKLVIGVRLTIVDEAIQERTDIYQPKVYPKNKAGIKLLYKYLSKSYERPYFYEQPRLCLETFLEMLNEGIKNDSFVVSSGDINSLLMHPKQVEIIEKITNVIGQSNFVYDIIPLNTPLWQRLTWLALKGVEASKNKVNVFVPAFYKREDHDAFPIHYSIHKNVLFNFLRPYHHDFYYDGNEFKRLINMLPVLEERYGFKLTEKLQQEKFPVRYKWEKQDPRLPVMAPNPDEQLLNLCIQGLKDKIVASYYGYKISAIHVSEKYLPRLKYELETIKKLGFANYILMVYNLVDYCKKANIKMGPGRGSVGGSLIAYLIGITDVDPIRFDLMFERFINPTRIDLPDIDLDFMSTRRHEIIEYLESRYGKDNVAGIVNYSGLQSKSALRNTCRILNMPDQEYECSKLLPNNFGKAVPLEEAKDQVIEVKNFAAKYPDVWKLCVKIEGKLRNYSTHAAGIIVSDRPLVEDSFIQISKGNRVVNWDKNLCEKQGLIKLDVLGLSTLDVLDLTAQLIEEKHGVSVNFKCIDLKDIKTLEYFEQGKTAGVFQFEGGSVKRLLKDLSRTKSLTFDDLVAANALNRPGPIEAGLVDMYVDGKNGNLHDTLHPSMDEILSNTFNVMVYQEQIMKVCVDFAGYTLPEADNLRKIMGKKLPEKMKLEEKKFVEGAVSKHGISSELAQRVFDQISKFAFYAFNKSHSVEYSLIGFICMWLKVYFPVEYYSAALSYADDKKLRTIINEANKDGIEIAPPDINTSKENFYPASRNKIVAPLNKIKFVSAAAKTIILERETNGPFTSIADLEARTLKRLVNKRCVEAMRLCGALDSIDPESASMGVSERTRALNEYLGSIPLSHVHIGRGMMVDTSTKKALTNLLNEIKDGVGSGYVAPYIGKDMKVMVVVDSATTTEAKAGMLTESRGFNPIRLAMKKAGMAKEDFYWTALVKRKKDTKEKIFNNTVLENSFLNLTKEIEILKPTVILCLGTQTAKMFDPQMKGSAVDNTGRILYDEKLDANIVLGFNPSMLFFKPELEPELTELFGNISDMV